MVAWTSIMRLPAGSLSTVPTPRPFTPSKMRRPSSITILPFPRDTPIGSWADTTSYEPSSRIISVTLSGSNTDRLYTTPFHVPATALMSDTATGVSGPRLAQPTRVDTHPTTKAVRTVPSDPRPVRVTLPPPFLACRRALKYTSGSRTLLSGPNGNRLHPPLHMNLTAGLEPIEAEPNQPSLLAYATDDRIAHHELDIEVAGEALQTACYVDGVADHDIVQPMRIVRQLPRALKRPAGVVGAPRRCAKRRHDGIADVLLVRATMIEDDVGDPLVELRQQRDRGLRAQRFAEMRESSDVGEEHGHRLASRRHARRARPREGIDHIRGEVSGEAGSFQVIGHLPSQQAPRARHGRRQHRREEGQEHCLSTPRRIAHIERIQIELERRDRAQPGLVDGRAVDRDRAGQAQHDLVSETPEADRDRPGPDDEPRRVRQCGSRDVHEQIEDRGQPELHLWRPARGERNRRQDDPDQECPFEDSENTGPEDGPPIAAPEQILHHAGCGKCRDDEEAWNRSGGCVVRNERHGHDGEQGEPDAEMESETLLLGIGHRPVDA